MEKINFNSFYSLTKMLFLKDIFTFITMKCLSSHHQQNKLHLLTSASCPRVPALLYCISLWLDSEARVTSLLNAFPPCRCSNLYFTSSKTKAQKIDNFTQKPRNIFWNGNKEQLTLMKLQQNIIMSNRLGYPHLRFIRNIYTNVS